MVHVTFDYNLQKLLSSLTSKICTRFNPSSRHYQTKPLLCVREVEANFWKSYSLRVPL